MSEQAVWKTCTGDMLETETRNGWSLVDTRDEDRQELGQSYSTQEVVNGYSQYVSKMGPPVVVKRPVFVLARTRDEEMTRLRAEAALQRSECVCARDAQKAAEKERDAAKAQTQEKVKVLEDAWADGKRYREELATSQAKARKLEEDIAKIRQEIGEGRMREILAAGSQTGGADGKR